MYNFPIGVIVESFRGTTEERIKKAAGIGAAGIQMFMTAYGLKENHVDNMTDDRVKYLLDLVKSEGMKFSAICGDFGGDYKGGSALKDKVRNVELIEKQKRVMDFALKFETNIVTTHIGVVPQDSNSEEYKIQQAACFELAEYADSLGAHFAIETGPETAAHLGDFLDTLNSRGVAVNFDPANLVMCVADNDLAAGVHRLKDYIVHTHAKDGMMLKNVDAANLYEAGDIVDAIESGRAFIELPLGQGNVNWNGYLRALQDIGYKGFLTIERECGDDPDADIIMAAQFLRDKIASL